MEVLIVIDVQQDFCPGGALAVSGGNEIVPVINNLSQAFDHVILTQDWHPEGHSSFASSHSGKAPFDQEKMSYGEQVLWPDHCIQGSAGASFHPSLVVDKAELIIRKGFRSEIDSYSAFFENDHATRTGLAGYLRERGFQTICLAGLATDFCVKWSALDGVHLGFEVMIIEDAVRGIDTEGSLERAYRDFAQAGVKLISSHSILSL